MGFEGSVPCCIFRFIVNYGFSTDNFEKKKISLSDFVKSSRKLKFLVLNFLLFALSGTLDVGITQPLYCWFVIGSENVQMNKDARLTILVPQVHRRISPLDMVVLMVR